MAQSHVSESTSRSHRTALLSFSSALFLSFFRSFCLSLRLSPLLCSPGTRLSWLWTGLAQAQPVSMRHVTRCWVTQRVGGGKGGDCQEASQSQPWALLNLFFFSLRPLSTVLTAQVRKGSGVPHRHHLVKADREAVGDGRGREGEGKGNFFFTAHTHD